MRGLIALATLFASPAHAAERRWPVGSIERLRIEAPVTVHVVTGGGNGVRGTAADRATLDALELRVDGNTLTIRAPRGTAKNADLVVATPRLDTIALFSATTVRIDVLRGARVTVSTAGTGSILIGRVDAERFDATLVGEGTITAAGRATETRLAGNGPGIIDAAALASERTMVQAAGDLIVRAAARSVAQISAGPDAQVTIAGRPQCTIRAARPTNIRC
ncbi:GIN domain-containing protein [Sphingomonas sp. 8AM]|uniref:GIN domain-containing protein n=1 Tax=Sphingomonas sp. 8AM TaxID=2653170 RepID=UPI0012F2EA63|nr:DUF2807 domain-containing protein [Sphingomonas sp. 8AM]VXC74930.1 conserved hypothetical protein [Sphingomonas sp. 8AM]